MGYRLSTNFRASPYAIRHVEISEAGKERLKAGLGIDTVGVDEALKIEPKCPEALNNIGLCYLRDGLPDRASEPTRPGTDASILRVPSAVLTRRPYSP